MCHRRFARAELLKGQRTKGVFVLRCVTKAGDDGELAACSSQRLRREPPSSPGTIWHQTAAAACVIVSASVIAGPLPCYFQNHHLYILFSLGVAAFLPLSNRVEERMDFLLGESEEPQGLGGWWGVGGGGARLPASYSWSLDVCVCVWCAAVQGVFCNDGNRQSLGHQECGGSQRAAAHQRPRLRRIKEAEGEKKRKILLLSSAPATAFLSFVLRSPPFHPRTRGFLL